MNESVEYTDNIAKRASGAKREIRTLKTSIKNDVLKLLAEELLKNKESIIKENAKDIEAGKEKNLSPALLDRLLLNEKRIESLANSVLEIASLPDPIGEVVRGVHLPNGDFLCAEGPKILKWDEDQQIWKPMIDFSDYNISNINRMSIKNNTLVFVNVLP